MTDSGDGNPPGLAPDPPTAYNNIQQQLLKDRVDVSGINLRFAYNM